jgi:hypothetical protein
VAKVQRSATVCLVDELIPNERRIADRDIKLCGGTSGPRDHAGAVHRPGHASHAQLPASLFRLNVKWLQGHDSFDRTTKAAAGDPANKRPVSSAWLKNPKRTIKLEKALDAR